MPRISLEAVRVNAGYNQKEWAEIFGISNSTVVNWEKGKRSRHYHNSEK